MVFVGMDLHQKESQLCALSDQGEVLKEVRVATVPEVLEATFSKWKPFKVLLEASTDSVWVAPLLEGFEGCEGVVIADPNDASLYGKKGRAKQKTDKRDAYALADALASGRYSATHRASSWARKVRRQVNGRSQLVAQRTALVLAVKAELKLHGLQGKVKGEKSKFASAVRESEWIPKALREDLEPTLKVLDAIAEAVKTYEARIKSEATPGEDKPRAKQVARMMTVPGIGALTAVALLARLDTVERFKDSSHMAAYLGLVPKARGSGETNGTMGHITRAGDPYVRALLVQGAMRLLQSRKTKDGQLATVAEEALGLRSWAGGLMQRKGRMVAAVALARRMARIAWACAVKDEDFKPEKCARRPALPQRRRA